MADDEVRHAAIGINLNINGMDELLHVNDAVDRLVNSMRDASAYARYFKDVFNNIGGDASTTMNRANDAVKAVRQSMNSVQTTGTKVGDSIRHLSSDFDIVRGAAEKVSRSMKFAPDVVGLSSKLTQVRGEFGKTQKVAKEFQKSLNFGSAGKFKINSSGITKSEDNLKRFKSTLSDLPTTKVKEIGTNFENSGRAIKHGSSLMTSFSDHVDKARDRTKRFHDILWGSFVGTALSNGIQTIGSDLWQSAKSGFQLVMAGQQIQTQWKNIGLSDSGAKKMLDQISDIRGRTGMAGSAIDAMQKKFYALTDSAPKARALTNEIAAFGSAAGKSGGQIQQLAMGMTRSLGSKKVSVGFFNRAFGQLPALQTQIEKASHMTNAAFQNALKNGNITGNQLEGYMMKAAKNSSLEWAVFAKSTKGKLAGIKGEFINLTAAFNKPIVGGISKAIESLSKKKGGIKAVNKELEGIATALGRNVGNFVGKAIEFITMNRKPLGDIVKDVTSIGKNLVVGAWKVISSTMNLIAGKSGPASHGIHGVATALNAIADKRSAIQDIGKALLGLFVT